MAGMFAPTRQFSYQVNVTFIYIALYTEHSFKVNSFTVSGTVANWLAWLPNSKKIAGSRSRLTQ